MLVRLVDFEISSRNCPSSSVKSEVVVSLESGSAGGLAHAVDIEEDHIQTCEVVNRGLFHRRCSVEHDFCLVEAKSSFDFGEN